MKKFIVKIIYFILPICLIVFPIELWLAHLGESTVLEKVHQLQEENNQRLFMRGVLSQDYNTYKSIGIQKVNPDILVLGSSRVMQFREFMFNDNYSFYNAGGILQCADDLVQFAKMINEEKYKIPIVIIVGIDPWWLKEDGQPTKSWLRKNALVDHATRPSAHLSVLKKLVTSFDKYFQKALYPENIGLNSKITGGGFRYDGSKAPEIKVLENFDSNPVYRDREIPPVKERIRKAITNRFTISAPDTLRYLALEKALLELQKKCTLIIYMPPFSDESISLLDQSDSHKEWWNFYTIYVSERLKKDFKYIIKVQSPSAYGLSDKYFFDGFHPSEVFVGHQLKKFTEDNSEIGKYVSQGLDQLLAKAYNPLVFNRMDN